MFIEDSMWRCAEETAEADAWRSARVGAYPGFANKNNKSRHFLTSFPLIVGPQWCFLASGYL
jgi:hypothetical protein